MFSALALLTPSLSKYAVVKNIDVRFEKMWAYKNGLFQEMIISGEKSKHVNDRCSIPGGSMKASVMSFMRFWEMFLVMLRQN